MVLSIRSQLQPPAIQHNLSTASHQPQPTVFSTSLARCTHVFIRRDHKTPPLSPLYSRPYRVLHSVPSFFTLLPLLLLLPQSKSASPIRPAPGHSYTTSRFPARPLSPPALTSSSSQPLCHRLEGLGGGPLEAPPSGNPVG